MEDEKKVNENYDALNSWREENFGSYAGGSEEDATVEAIKAYEREKEQQKEQGMNR